MDLSGVCQVGQPMIIRAYVRDNITLTLTETGGVGGGGNRSCIKKMMGKMVAKMVAIGK